MRVVSGGGCHTIYTKHYLHSIYLISTVCTHLDMVGVCCHCVHCCSSTDCRLRWAALATAPLLRCAAAPSPRSRVDSCNTAHTSPATLLTQTWGLFTQLLTLLTHSRGLLIQFWLQGLKHLIFGNTALDTFNTQ